jgi:septal ring factor EnvC (AmiA/AmiB activator)
MGVAAMLVLMPLPAVAQTAPSAVNPQAAKKLTPEAARELYEQRRRDLKAVDEQRRSISRDVDETAFERAQLNSRLIERAQALQQAEQQLSSIEDQVFELRAKEQLKRMELGSKRAELTRILTILQRLGRQPPPVLVTERDDALAMVRSGMLLAYSYRTVKPLADKLSGDLIELRELSVQLAAEQKKQITAEDELKRERSEIETALKAKADTLKVNQAKLDDLKRIAMNYAQTINTLADVTGNLDRVVAEKTGLGLYEAELSKSAGVELKPDAKKIAFVQPGRLAPGIPFGQAKGMLPLPAQGRRLRNFGTADTYGGTAKGILI